MATINQKDNGDYYIKGKVSGAYCTWQVTDTGKAVLMRMGYAPGDSIRHHKIRWYVDKGYFFTNHSGLDDPVPSKKHVHSPYRRL
jgi:hypothetical protein